MLQLQEVERDLADTVAQLRTAEHKLRDADSLRQQLSEQRTQLTQLHNQLHDEQLQRSVTQSQG